MRRLQIQRAKFSLELCFIFILWPRTLADKLDTVQSAARELASPKTNQLHYAPNSEPDHQNEDHNGERKKEVSNFSEQEEHEYDDRLAQMPFQRQSILPQEPAPFTTKLEYQRKSSNRHPNSVQPVTNVRRQQSEIHYHKKKIVPDANYYMKFGGKEKFYTEDSTNEYRPLGLDEFSSPSNAGDKFTERSANKKNNYEKSYRKYKYTYSSNRGETGSNTPDYQVDDGVKARSPSNSAPNDKNYPKYVHHPSSRATDDQTPTMDFYTAKSTSWKQLGPNVEISTSAEHPIYSKRDSLSETSKSPNKKRKGSPKNVRSGYLNQQHALYIANNLANFANFPLRPVKGMFDHNHVMKQSDKFELSDAMFQELEEAKKMDEAQIRTKQETSKEQYHKYQPESVANGYHYQVNPALLNAAPIEANANPNPGKYYQPHPVSAFSKGFIRHIEVETSPSGGKKMIPALIIPLTPDQLNNQFFNHDIGLYVNNPEVLNPTAKVRHQGQLLPFETINSRHLQQNDPYNNISPVDNYQYHQQVLSPYEFRIAEEGYNNPYVNYQSQNVYRLPYNFNGAPSTPASVDAKSPETRAAIYSAKKKHNHRASPSPSPSPSLSLQQQQQQQHEPQKIQVNRVSHHQVHPTENSKVNYKREEYVFDANKNENYLSASESYTTIASIKDKDQKMVEKIENKVN